MTTYYIDPATGSNSNPGSEALPFLNFQPVNTAGWSGTDVLVKRGTTMIINSGTRANIVAAAGFTLDAYGDTSLAKPIISGNSASFFPIWLQSCGGAWSIDNVHATKSRGVGIGINPTAGNSITGGAGRIRNCITSYNNQDGNSGSDGLSIGLNQAGGGVVTDVTVEDCVHLYEGGHGCKVRGLASNIKVKRAIALYCGQLSPAHGLGTSGNRYRMNEVALGAPGAAAWSDTGLTGSVTGLGKVWEFTVPTQQVDPITDWPMVALGGASPYYHLVKATGHLTQPDPGEYGIAANNTLRINIGAVITPNTCDVSPHYSRPQNVYFMNCVAGYTNDSNGIEGQAIYFDSGSDRCWSVGCVTLHNEGQGFYTNMASNCGHYNGFGYLNGKGGARAGMSTGNNFSGLTLVCLPGTYGIEMAVGTASGRADRNQIIGATVGIQTNDLSTNTLTENENVFVDCALRLADVSGIGARSMDRAALLASTCNTLVARGFARAVAGLAAL